VIKASLGINLIIRIFKHTSSKEGKTSDNDGLEEYCIIPAG
jgi:hypothetical protein